MKAISPLNIQDLPLLCILQTAQRAPKVSLQETHADKSRDAFRGQ